MVQERLKKVYLMSVCGMVYWMNHYFLFLFNITCFQIKFNLNWVCMLNVLLANPIIEGEQEIGSCSAVCSILFNILNYPLNV
jgi:hypothetical protein